VPDPAWSVPAPCWSEAIARYTVFLRIPSWRASVRRSSHEAGLSSAASASLRQQMMAALARAGGERLPASKPLSRHLTILWNRRGRTMPRAERCPMKLQVHFQRAFVLNAGGYACAYCGRTAWEVYEEHYDDESPRTLRFEVDHHITRGRLPDPSRFDPKNLVVACRSCNVIKGEMTVRRFRIELESLAAAVASTDSRRRSNLQMQPTRRVSSAPRG